MQIYCERGQGLHPAFRLGRERTLAGSKDHERFSADTVFLVSQRVRRCSQAAARVAALQLYRVHLFTKRPRVFTLAPPLADAVKLTTEVWRASF